MGSVPFCLIYQAFGGGGGCFLFLPFWGTPKDMDLRNAYV